jgi:hypothetical protein
MDKHQLVTIAITAAITVTIRELLAWAVSFPKKWVTSEPTKATARKLFSKANRAIMWDILWIAWMIFLLVRDFRDKSPVTRGDVFAISLLTIGILTWLLSLTWHIGTLRLNRLLPPD